MEHGIVIIGSGFAARQLVKNLRKLNADVPLTLIAADSMDEYNKPDLSHVISQGVSADAMTRQTAGEFAEQFNVALFPGEWVTQIDTRQHKVHSSRREWDYDKLVLATGASALLPPIAGRELMITLNSQEEYRASESQLHAARRVVILGGGLIGSELAMDFSRAGKSVCVVDSGPCLMSSLMPPEASSRLQSHLHQQGVELLFGQQLQAVARTGDGVQATLGNGRVLDADIVVAAIGLRPNIDLAQQAGLAVNRGIVVNHQLQSSQPDIYALGDCAEVDGQVLPFLQPTLLAAMTLAKNVLGDHCALQLPGMLVKIKTPDLPLQLAGDTRRGDLTWQITRSASGMVARGYDSQQVMRAFVVSEDEMKQGFALLKQLNAA
ncbi:NADH:flavorubredoxin reductase NorW [Shimwellia pseudoproteus]|uniref:NADH:flavorubredoxin reductase NorW n=1 Tax=Shimwellia pseudoproteus TaxID=570012 RepID=UPI0018EBB8EC|nr:NADH:flavorubredoxin reductase NorW [Shimwellia pseudoproteus]MBJ3816502.1 NADH:flavorubredoxin reductase NorW [Shimwellia pseudoproteus]